MMQQVLDCGDLRVGDGFAKSNATYLHAVNEWIRKHGVNGCEM